MIRLFFSLLIILLAAPTAPRAGAVETVPLTTSLLENDVLRLRVLHLTGDFAAEFLAAQPTNKFDGIVLDLRSADGDKNAAAAAGDFFAAKKFPLVILVNGQTRGAASALAAQLRASGPAVVIGSTDTAPTIRPDITVAVSAADEQKFLEDPYFTAPVPVQLSTTNDLLPFVDHMSEADLVRRKIKDGEGAPGAAPLPRPEPPPVIRDPALARAVDLLKALAVLHPARG
jgi:hypothetical protein